MNLDKVPVTEVMSKNIVSVSSMQKLLEVKHIFEKKDFHHHIPVTENGKLIGMISLVDFLFSIKTASLDDNEAVYHNLKVKDIMRDHPASIETTSSLKDALIVLAKGEVHALAICKNNILSGIISTTDIIQYFLKINA